IRRGQPPAQRRMLSKTLFCKRHQSSYHQHHQRDPRITPRIQPPADLMQEIDDIALQQKRDLPRHVITLALLQMNHAVDWKISHMPALLSCSIVEFDILHIHENVLVEEADLTQAFRFQHDTNTVENLRLDYVGSRELTEPGSDRVANPVTQCAEEML